jgi:cyanuric acid amidohydrolase
VNDFSRTLSALVWESKILPSAVTVFSGGTEGVLCPHVTFIVQEKFKTGLVACVGRTRCLEPYEIGTEVHAQEVRKTVSQLINEAGIDKKSVHLVLIKCPLLTSTKVEAIRVLGKTPQTTDTYESMALSRYASAVGIGAALEEVEESKIADALAGKTQWSSKASCSSGAELEDNHILVLASDATAKGGKLHASSSYMKDAIDAGVILKMLDQITDDGGEVVQVFAKAEANPAGHIRGRRHTMNTDSDIHSTRHARAAVGGLVAGLVGDSAVYISGGAEGQGPPGGGSLCIVYSTS